ncbi:hypothetical protein HDU86_005908 [Geranomyces michiganensis]|nr:hypothetical protein HDU86_005908 [Geranomyces michiganensis]
MDLYINDDHSRSEEDSTNWAANAYPETEELRDQRARRQAWKEEAQRVRSALSKAEGVVFVPRQRCRKPVTARQQRKISEQRDISATVMRSSSPEDITSTEAMEVRQMPVASGRMSQRNAAKPSTTLAGPPTTAESPAFPLFTAACQYSPGLLPEGTDKRLPKSPTDAASPVKQSQTGRSALTKDLIGSPASYALLREHLDNFARFTAERREMSETWDAAEAESTQSLPSCETRKFRLQVSSPIESPRFWGVTLGCPSSSSAVKGDDDFTTPTLNPTEKSSTNISITASNTSHGINDPAPDSVCREFESPNLPKNADTSAYMVIQSGEVLGDYFDELPDMSEPNPLYNSPPASPRHGARFGVISTDATGHTHSILEAASAGFQDINKESTPFEMNASIVNDSFLPAAAENCHNQFLPVLPEFCVEPIENATEGAMLCHQPATFVDLSHALMREPFYTVPPPLRKPPQHRYTWYDITDGLWTPPIPSWAAIQKSRPRGRGRADRRAKALTAYYDATGDGTVKGIIAAEAAVSQLRQDLKMLKNRRTKQLHLHSTKACAQ